MGSCFTESIGRIMGGLKYDVDMNPFGVLYNPMSVGNGLKILLENEEFDKNNLVKHHGLWHSFSHHGQFSSVDERETLERINLRIKGSSDFLHTSDFLFLTFGTAWVYRYAKTNEIVSNCHKIPAREFVRERVSAEKIIDTYSEILHKIWQVNPRLKVIFTVSPIRHWKDGAVENQRSKSTLFLAIDRLEELFPDKCAYFPSYEIVMDELRDYRFYAPDMLHLSEVAVSYIWERFSETFVDDDSLKISKEVSKINSAVKHRSISSESSDYHDFIKTFLKKTEEMGQRFPFLDFKLEKTFFNTRMDNLGAQEDGT